MESLDHNFQDIITEINFKTLHNREIGYADLFSDYRTIVFSAPKPSNMHTWDQIKRYDRLLPGIDKIACVSSNPAIIPFVEAHSKSIIPLYDHSLKFLSLIKQHVGKTLDDKYLSQFWQYATIINRGNIEKFLQNGIKADLPLRIFSSTKYQYRDLTPEKLLGHTID